MLTRADISEAERVRLDFEHAQQQLFQDPNNYENRFNLRTGRDESVYRSAFLRGFTMPSDYSATPHPPEVPPKATLEWIRHKEDTICAIFGITKALLSSEKVTRDANIEA